VTESSGALAPETRPASGLVLLCYVVVSAGYQSCRRRARVGQCLATGALSISYDAGLWTTFRPMGSGTDATAGPGGQEASTAEPADALV